MWILQNGPFNQTIKHLSWIQFYMDIWVFEINHSKQIIKWKTEVMNRDIRNENKKTKQSLWQRVGYLIWLAVHWCVFCGKLFVYLIESGWTVSSWWPWHRNQPGMSSLQGKFNLWFLSYYWRVNVKGFFLSVRFLTALEHFKCSIQSPLMHSDCLSELFIFICNYFYRHSILSFLFISIIQLSHMTDGIIAH